MTTTPPPTRRARVLPAALPSVVTALLLTVALASPALRAQTGVGQGRLDVLNARGEVTPLQPVLVVSETLDEVRFRRGSSERTESRRTDQVVQVVYGAGSSTYDRGLEALGAGDLVQAVNLLTEAAGQSDPPWQAPVALLKLAEAQARRGGTHVAEARDTLDRFLREHPEHRRLPEALIERARYAHATGEASALQTAVDRVEQLVDQGRAPGTWHVRALIELGHVRLAADDAAGARQAFERAVSVAQRVRGELDERADLRSELDELLLDARSGIGAALLAAGDLAGARSYYGDLQRDAGDNLAIRVAALNGLAQADFEEGGGDRLKQAQLGFAKASVLGAGNADQHAKSLYFLGRVALALGEAGRLAPDAAQAEARQYARLVTTRYPETRWARLARESLP